nr:hypothetical protein [Enterobacter asburiae]
MDALPEGSNETVRHSGSRCYQRTGPQHGPNIR